MIIIKNTYKYTVYGDGDPKHRLTDPEGPETPSFENHCSSSLSLLLTFKRWLQLLTLSPPFGCRGFAFGPVQHQRHAAAGGSREEECHIWKKFACCFSVWADLCHNRSRSERRGGRWRRTPGRNRWCTSYLCTFWSSLVGSRSSCRDNPWISY